MSELDLSQPGVKHEDIVREAREWVGTRYQHQAHRKGQATDCIGLIYGVGAALGLMPDDPAKLPEAQRFAGYEREARNGSLLYACRLFLHPIEVMDMRPGDVILMRFNEEPQHVGILGDYPYGGLSLIHSYALQRRVVEARLDETWRNRIVGAFSFKGVQL